MVCTLSDDALYFIGKIDNHVNNYLKDTLAFIYLWLNGNTSYPIVEFHKEIKAPEQEAQMGSAYRSPGLGWSWIIG